jgi:hypothetical protein
LSNLELEEPTPSATRRCRLAQHQQLLQDQHIIGTAAPRNPAREHHAQQLCRPAGAGRADDLKRSSTEPHHQRSRSPPQNSTPATPPLLNAASWRPTRPYTMYTTRSVVPPSSRRRSGRQREREPANLRRRGGSNGEFQKFALLHCSGEGDKIEAP